ncbi:hypothetical protein JCM16303_005512 [Sporobolomyces ruberrimus]
MVSPTASPCSTAQEKPQEGSATIGSSRDQADGTTTSQSLPRAKGKGKGRERDNHAYGSSPIQNLPLECLTHIFAHLAPRELGTCQLVCRVWNEVVGDETSWRTAFETYYGVTATSLGRRIEPSSWRAEYIARVALMRLWHRSRTPTVIHNPSLGALSSIHIQLPSTTSNPLQSSKPSTPSLATRRDLTSPVDLTLLSLSLDLGAAVHSIPFTGKLSKRPLLSTPIDHLGRPIVNLPIISATSFGVSPHDGSRLVWGMRDGSIRISNSSPSSSGRGSVGSTIDQGEVRSVLEAHREGTAVQLVTFSNVGGSESGRLVGGGVKQRVELFVTVGKDGWVNVWTLSVPPVAGARERAPPAVKVWSGRWDVKIVQPPTPVSANNGGEGITAAEVMRHRVRATATAFDSGWLSRHNGRTASLAVGRSDGKVVVWPSLDLPEGPGEGPTKPVEPIVLEADEIGRIDHLIFDTPSNVNGSRSLLVHSDDSTQFSRYTFPSSSSASSDAPVTRVVFGHPLPNQLSIITAFAVDFDEPPPLPLPSQPATPNESSGTPSISLIPPRLISLASYSSALPSMSRTTSSSTIPPSSVAAALGSNLFGRKKFVVAGDNEGRVYLWDWNTEAAPGEVVAPVKMVQGLEIPEGGGNASKITALEVTEAGVFVGGLDGTLRFYSTLGDASTPQPAVRTFRDRSAPRHPSRMLAQGLIADDDEERWLVSHIRANRDCVVAAIGGRILAWRTEPILKKKGGFGKPGKVTARQERFKANIELQHQVRESMSALSAESSARVERFEEEHRLTSQFGLPPSLDNLTEEEAIAFAMILSAEEEERKLLALAMDNGKGREMDEEANEGEWEQPPDEWLADDGVLLDEDYDEQPSGSGLRQSSNIVIDDYEDATTPGRSTQGGESHSHSPSTSLNVPSSPFLRGSSLSNGSPSPSPRSFSAYNWKPASAASSPSLSALGSPTSTSNAKLQISPRLGPTYGSSYSNYANDAVPDMDPSLWPQATSASTSPPPLSSRKSSFASISPAPSPSSPSFSRASSPQVAAPNGASTPIRRGWSQVAARASPAPSNGTSSPRPILSASPSPGPSSPWANRTPAPSLLSEQLRVSATTAADEEAERRRKREEEDLRFALELSMVEEASRLEI